MRYVVMLDGGFVIKRLQVQLSRFPSAADVMSYCRKIETHAALAQQDLLRIYFYDGPPPTGQLTNPIDGSRLDLAKSGGHTQPKKLHDDLELSPNVALRLGDTVLRGWKIRDRSFRTMTRSPTPLTASDLTPNLSQKGVDLRIGLDIARVSLRGLAEIVVLVTGDSDLVPAMKFARREGVLVYLDTMQGSGVKRALRVHADLTL